MPELDAIRSSNQAGAVVPADFSALLGRYVEGVAVVIPKFKSIKNLNQIGAVVPVDLSTP